MKKLIHYTFIVVLFLSNHAFAKWADKENAALEVSYHDEITVNRDGTFEQTREATEVILNELGRHQAASTTLYYNGDSDKIKIIAAKTIYRGQEYPVPSASIEDKPLASAQQGFDQKRQILIAFPNVEIGSKIYLKYQFIQKKPVLDNFFSNLIYLGRDELDDKISIKIKSALPLNVLVNDPKGALNISEKHDQQFYYLTIKQTKAIYQEIINEPQPIIPNDQDFTWISISSLKKWEELGKKHGVLVNKIFSQSLPPMFNKILNKAKKIDNEVGQINLVTSLLNDKVRYMGDWRSVSGRYVPRDLAQIADSQFGDCKDFSAATAAILTKLGYKAKLAMVVRGIAASSSQALPGFYTFNHMITKIISKSGKVYWIDPTNISSMADGTFADIADRSVLVSDPKEASYEKISAIDPSHAVVKLDREWMIKKNQVIERGQMLLKNESAQSLTGIQLFISKDTIKDVIFNLLAGNNTLDEKDKKRIKLPKLTSRIVKDITINYQMIRKNELIITNVGPALKLTYDGPIKEISNISPDFIADKLIANSPSTLYRSTIIKNVKAKNIDFLTKKITTPWIEVERKCSIKGKDLIINDKIIVRKNIISRTDFNQPKFIELKNWLQNNFKEVILVIEKL